MVHGPNGQVLDVGRKTRVIPTAMRRALAERDGGCRFPGCDHTRFVDGHHIKHWADGGETKLDNLVELCRFHHRLLHEGGFIVRRAQDSELEFVAPTGKPLPRVPVLVPADDEAFSTAWRCLQENAGVVAELPAWEGGPIDYGWVIEDLMIAREREAGGRADER